MPCLSAYLLPILDDYRVSKSADTLCWHTSLYIYPPRRAWGMQSWDPWFHQLVCYVTINNGFFCFHFCIHFWIVNHQSVHLTFRKLTVCSCQEAFRWAPHRTLKSTRVSKVSSDKPRQATENDHTDADLWRIICPSWEDYLSVRPAFTDHPTNQPPQPVWHRGTPCRRRANWPENKVPRGSWVLSWHTSTPDN